MTSRASRALRVSETSKVIYGLHRPDGVVRYVGFTTVGATERLKVHRYNACYGIESPLYDWMRKYYDRDDTAAKVLEEFDSDTELSVLHEREVFWIAELETYLPLGKGGLNSTEGGAGGWPIGRPKSDSWRKAQAAYWATEEAQAAGSARSKAIWTPERHERHREYQAKKWAEPGAREAQAARVAGRRSPEGVARHKQAMRKYWAEQKKAGRFPPGMHVRWHVNRGIVSPACPLCAPGEMTTLKHSKDSTLE